ncbi:[acyl-carrier-protein] S-malonyltransferase [Streptomyces sp. V4I23]|uniref:acyltransferase domain-containing protein n=1 Tax=Streptomyces sp. V4I23 TaxID=3042282 RepID=UPI002786ACE2|nr:acyltransferase domain-containing protein [Streptomyces sp. V4I23]MDQ1005671.1 [acyl-carrier-protein] S-malonyltransferase [Streptomyces sp. V4I23]
MAVKTALLFPGPGAYLPGVLAPFAEPDTAAHEALQAIDAVAEKHSWGKVSSVLTSPADATTPSRPESLWLGFYATSIVMSDALEAAGVECDTLVGHSGGEISALTVAGSLSVADGARVLVERVLALSRASQSDGTMMVVSAAAHRAEALCQAVGDASLALAVDNTPRQSVVCGRRDAIIKLEELAVGLGWETTRLAMPYMLHNPLLAGAAEDFLDAIADVRVRAPRRSVYSPLLGRLVLTAADAREVLECHLVRPVRFRDALSVLYREGTERFIECGARRVLTDLVAATLPAEARALAILDHRNDASGLAKLMTSFLSSSEVEPAPVVVAPEPAARNSVAEQTGATSAPAEGTLVDEQTSSASAPAHPALPVDDETLHEQLMETYAAVLQYPADVFTRDADLEGDLGVSSIKQTEIFARLLDRYDLPTPSSDTRVSAYRTLGQIGDLLRSLAAAA